MSEKSSKVKQYILLTNAESLDNVYLGIFDNETLAQDAALKDIRSRVVDGTYPEHYIIINSLNGTQKHYNADVSIELKEI